MCSKTEHVAYFYHFSASDHGRIFHTDMIFVKGTDALLFEELQSDLFDHLLAVLPEFGLRIFQNPTGFYNI